MPQPPLLQLPMEIREHIYELVIHGTTGVFLSVPKGPINRKMWQDEYHRVTPRRFRQTGRRQRAAIDDLDWRTERREQDHLVFTFQEQSTVCLGIDGHAFSTIPLAHLNRQLREEVCDYQRLWASEVITQVWNFDFDGTIRYLKGLPSTQQEGFAVDRCGTYRKLLRIELRGPYDEQCGPNLERWLKCIVEVVENDGKLATAFKMNWKNHKERMWPTDLKIALSKLESAYEKRSESAARLELNRLICAFQCSNYRYQYFHFSGLRPR